MCVCGCVCVCSATVHVATNSIVPTHTTQTALGRRAMVSIAESFRTWSNDTKVSFHGEPVLHTNRYSIHIPTYGWCHLTCFSVPHFNWCRLALRPLLIGRSCFRLYLMNPLSYGLTGGVI